jgi:sulfur carrier protein
MADTITITLNGERTDLPAGSSVEDLLEISGAGRNRVAVVLNETIVRPGERAATILNQDDRLDLLVFAGGG